MVKTANWTRRSFLGSTASVAAGLAIPSIVTGPGLARAAGTEPVSFQLAFFPERTQIGEIAAKRLGYFEEEKIALTITPGGPNINGVSLVEAGRSQFGTLGSSSDAMLAVSQSRPIMGFAVGLQRLPYSYISLAKKPLRTPSDLKGKKFGVNPTSRQLLASLLKVNGLTEADIEIIPTTDPGVLLSGQVDVFGGFITNSGSIKLMADAKAQGDEPVVFSLWDGGARFYANIYYATVETLQTKPELATRFLRACSRGWQFAYENPAKAIELMVEEYPNLKPVGAYPLTDVLGLSFTPETRATGWGGFDLKVWDEQVKLFDGLKQFERGKVPQVKELVTTSILDATADIRPKLG